MLRAAQARARAHPVRTALGTIMVVALALRVGYVLATPQHVVPAGDAGGYYERALYLFQYGHLRPYFPGGQLPVTQLGHNGIPLQPKGGSPDAYWPPIFPMVLAGLMWVYSHFSYVGNALLPAPGLLAFLRLAQTLTNTIAVGCIGVIGIRVFGRRAGLIAAAIAAIFPAFIYVGASLYSESLFVPMVAATLAAFVEYRRSRRRRWLLLTGVLTGLGTITHSDGFVLVVPLVVMLWPRGLRRSGSSFRRDALRAFGPLAGVLLVVVLVLAPWTIRNEVKFHHFIPVSTSAGETLAGTFNFQSIHNTGTRDKRYRPVPIWLNPQGKNGKPMASFKYVYREHPRNQVAQSAALEHAAFKYMEAHPGEVLRVMYWNTRRLLDLVPLRYSNSTAALEGISPRANKLGILGFWIVAVLALIGVFRRKAWRAEAWWLWITPVLFYLLAVLFSAQTPRFQAPPDLFIVLLAGLGVERLLLGGRALPFTDRLRT